MQTRRIISVWDKVQPSLWHPLASLEQSLMDVEVMARRVFSPRIPPYAPLTQDMLMKLHYDDEEFFEDLPLKRPDEAIKETLEAAAPKYSASSSLGAKAAGDTKESSTGAVDTVPHPSYTSYSYTYSTVLDKRGHRVGTTRRRYEDSTGCLKATHEREIDGKKMKMAWRRLHAQDEGGHETTCTSGSPDDFEKEWLDTPFGRAEEEELAQWIETRERSVHEAFGIDYKTDESMHNLQQSRTTPQERKMAEEGSEERKEVIRKMAQRQEEETTPPQYL